MYRKLDQNSDSSDDNMSQSLIEDILIPYCTKLPQELSVGSFIEIFGKTDENAKLFAINLITDSDDIALHFNPRLEDSSVIRNSRIQNEWNNEERDYAVIMPFAKNKTFTFIISVDKEVYRLYVNGIHFIDFRHRVPYNSVTSIAIEGDLQVLWIKCDRLEAGLNWDDFSTSLSPSIQQQSHESQTFFDPKVPFVEDIIGGLREGMVLSIIGRPLSIDQKFEINLIQKKESLRNPNIAFHLSVRFGKTIGESLVVRNYRFEAEWGNEDRYCDQFPFSVEKIFDLRIIVEKNRFILIVNGKNFTEFPVRLFPLSDTNQIEIYGNLRLFSVKF